MAPPGHPSAHPAPSSAEPLRARRRWLCAALIAAASSACSSGPPPPSHGAALPATVQSARPAPPPAPAPVAEAPPAAPTACEPLRTAPFEMPQHGSIPLADVPVEWDERLASFYEALARLERGSLKQPLRIGVHGDSNLTKDGLTGELRRVLQGRYGDAGHGFVAAVKAWGWYRHQDVQQGNDAWWRVLAISAPRTPDLGYGISGIAAVCHSPGGRTWVSTSEEGDPVGHQVSKIGVFYRNQPDGGRFQVQIDGETCDEVTTTSDTVAAGHRIYQVPDGPHRIDLLTTSGGEVRILGVSLERDRPGVVVDSFGVGGAYFQALTLDDHELSRQMAGKMEHSLVVYWLGANRHFSKSYSRDVKVVVEERRKARPDLPVLIVSPPDSHGEGAQSDPGSASITQQMREAAQENGCAFWPMRDAQGGEGASWRFIRAGLAVDKQHLSPEGSALMARVLLHELWKGYQRYLDSHPRAGCDSAPPRR